MTLTLPDEPALAGIPADELRMDLACGMYRDGKITAVTAAHLAGVSIVRFQEVLRDRSIPRAYDTGDLQEDLAFLRGRTGA
jgi:predicted HTH domain antitoxin